MENLSNRLARLKGTRESGGLQARLANLKATPPEDVTAQVEQVPDELGLYDKADKYVSEAMGPRGLSLAAGLNKGMSDLVDLPSTLANVGIRGVQGGVNALMGTDYSGDDLSVGRPSQAIDDMTGGFVTRATQRPLAKGEDPISDALYTAAEFGGSAAFPMAGALGKGDKLADVLRAGKVDLTGGVAAAAGGALTDNNPYGELAGMLTGMAAGKFAPNPIAAATGAWKGAFSDRTAEVAQANLLLQVEDGAETVLRAKRALADGEKGTLSQITGETGILNREAAVDLNSPVGREIQSVRNARHEQTKDLITQVGGGGTERSLDEVLAPVYQGRVNDINRGVRSNVGREIALNEQQMKASALRNEQATQQEAAELLAQQESRAAQTAAEVEAKRASDALNPNMPPEVASTRFSQTRDFANEAAREADLRPLIEKFESVEIPNADAAALRDMMNAAPKGMGKLDYKVASEDPEIQKFRKQLDNWQADTGGFEVDGKSVQSMIQDLKSIRHQASGAVLGKAKNERVHTLASSLMRDAEKFMASRSPEYSAFNAEYKMQKDTINQDVFSDMVTKKVPEAERARAFLRMKEKGATAGRQLDATGSKAVVDGFENYLRSVANKEGVDAGFVSNYDALLKQFPESRALMEDVIAKQEKLAEAKRVNTAQSGRLTKAVETRVKTSEAEAKMQASTLPKALAAGKEKAIAKGEAKKKGLRGTRIAKILDKPEAAMGQLISGDDHIKRLDEVISDIKGVEGANEALRTGLLKAITSRKTTSVDGGGKFDDDFIDTTADVAGRLFDRGLLSRAEQSEIHDLLARVEVDKMMRNARPSGPVSMPEIKRFMSSVMAVTMLRASGQNSLIMANAARRFALSQTKYKGSETLNVKDEMARMIADPERFLKGLEVPKGKMTEQEAYALLREHMARVSRRTAVGTSQTMKDED